jgi:hypothetical protein
VNKYTLQEITAALNTRPEALENLDPEEQPILQETVPPYIENTELIKNLIEQQREEIQFLRETINQQWSLLNGNSKGEPTA